MPTTTPTLVPVTAASTSTPVADGQHQPRTPAHVGNRTGHVLRGWRSAIATLVAALCMLVFIAPAPAQAMVTQAGAICSRWANTPGDGINVSFPRVSLSSREAVWLLAQAWTPDGRRYDSNWAYAQGDSDWMTPGPGRTGWTVGHHCAPRRIRSGALPARSRPQVPGRRLAPPPRRGHRPQRHWTLGIPLRRESRHPQHLVRKLTPNSPSRWLPDTAPSPERRTQDPERTPRRLGSRIGTFLWIFLTNISTLAR
jgi:hypothetical protein